MITTARCVVRLATAAVAVLAPACVLNAAPPTPAHWSVQQTSQKPVGPGTVFTFRLAATIDPGWHLYALEEPEGGPLATEIGLAQGDPLTLLGVTEPEPRKLPDPLTHSVAGIFLDHASFTLKVRAPRQRPPAGTDSHVLIRYQTCNQQVCLPPHTETVDFPLTGLLR